MSKLATLTGHTLRVLYLAVSPDGQTIVTGAGVINLSTALRVVQGVFSICNEHELYIGNVLGPWTSIAVMNGTVLTHVNISKIADVLSKPWKHGELLLFF